MISGSEKRQIKGILMSPQWKTIERVMEELQNSISKNSVLGSDQWETLKTALLNEGQIQGISKLKQELYKILQEEEQK